MSTTAVLIAVAVSLAVAMLNERWATPWTDALRKKGNLSPNQYNRLWAIAVVGSGLLTFVLIEPVLLNWLK
ncbi:hypothetical protein [Bradyrhizobium viridifuturi]|uniref:hypothetical protein n=1 Tax=Bradyrhizobium viridifuturi TaxID=1654716 RepID=UPI000AB8E5A4|nr:hypothetical protein [Bradyrhizobium viridifuturi]